MDMLSAGLLPEDRFPLKASAVTSFAMRCLLSCLTALSVVICAVLLTAAVVLPRPAHASNGQCLWEGGPGASQYPGCKLEDCMGAGGYAQCTDPVIRPESGFNDSQVDGQKFNYGFGTSNEYDEGDFCQGLGGTWSGFYGGCANLPSGYNSLGDASSESLALQGAQAGMNYKFGVTYNPGTNSGGCGSGQLVNDTGWGDSSTEWGPPSYQNGQLMADYRTQTYAATDSGCNPSNGSQQIKVIFTKRRSLSCPQQYNVRRLPNGYLQCFVPSTICVFCDTVGNPVSPVTGGKIEQGTDYQVAGAGGLSFGHYYNSQGAYRPPGSGAFMFASSDYWHFSYDRQLIAFSGNPQLMAAVHREDGSVDWFDGSGNEILNRTGAAARLVSNAGGGWTLTLENNDVEKYDANGNLVSTTTRAGLVTTLSYGANGKMSQITDSFGHTLGIAYNANNQLTTLTLPDGVSTISYGYGDQGQLTSITYADHTILQYEYEDANNPWLLTGITDESNQRYATYVYDPQGIVTHEEHAGGADAFDFNVGSVSSMTSVNAYATDALGAVRNYFFTNQNGVFKLNASGPYCTGCPNITNGSFDANGNPQYVSDLDYHTTYHAYDLTRNLETLRTEGLAAFGQATANSRTTTTQWHPTFRLPQQIAVYSGASATGTPLKTTSYTYDGYGNVLTKTIADGATGVSRTWTNTYYNSGLYGQVQSIDGPRTDVSDVASYTYYNCASGAQCGQIHTTTDALGHATSIDSYDANGNALQVTDPNGTVTLLTYDPRQRIKTRTVGGEQTRYDYYPTGLLQKVTQPDGSFLSYIYDAAHRLIEIDDATGDRLVYTLDRLGNRTQQQSYDPTGTLARTQASVYNSMGELWQILTSTASDSQATVYGYDNTGNRVSIQAPLGRNTSRLYDELNRLKQVTDSAGGNTSFTYDALDNLVAQTDPRNLATNYTYNGLGDLKQVVSPDTGTTQATFDSGGNLHSRTDARASTATFTYDALNRVTQVGYSDQTVTYTYDQGANALGRLSQITDGSGQTAFTYDPLGRVTRKQQVIGGVTLTVSYTYQNSELTTSVTPSGQQLSYTYDANGQVSGISVNGTTILGSVQYGSFGPTDGWTWGNGTHTSRGYDVDGRLLQVQSAGTSTYTYNDDGTIASRSDDSEHDYSVVPGTTSYQVSAVSNQLSGATGPQALTYTYDPAGNTTGNGILTYTYNGAGRMSSAVQGSVTTAFAVNALGQRVSKVSSGGTTLFAYDESGHLLGEYTGSGTLIEETVWLGDTPVATLRPNSTGGVDVYYVHTDHLNTPRRVTRPTDNTVVWRWSGDPYGVGFVDTDPDGDGVAFTYNLRFPGQYYDAETGLTYNYFRDYDAISGRYLESDPIGLRGGNDTYAYVGGQPTMRVDPNGLFQLTVATTWQSADDLPWGVGGETRDPISRAKCVCTNCGGSWVLSECSSFLLIKVKLRSGVTYPGLAEFFRSSEEQHVVDLKAGADDIRKAGQLEEARQRQRRWSNQSDCENEASKAVTREIVNVRNWYFDDSRRRWDDSGLHTARVPLGLF